LGLLVLFVAALILGLIFGAEMQRENAARTRNWPTPTAVSTEIPPPAYEGTEKPPQVPLLWEF
jgi:hypothetical protein